MYTDASGPNPVVNALDVLVLVTVSRMVMEDYAVEIYGTNALPVLEVHRQLETNVWEMSSAILKPEQQQELRNLIQDWRSKNPHLRYVGAVRFREFVAAMGKLPPPSKAKSSSVFSLLFLDPFAGLDPTAAAIEETRQLGERAMYYTQRMPQLISWQTELLAFELAMQPESTQVLSNANQLAASAEMFAKTTQQLPQLIAEQRKAAIQQILDGLSSQESQLNSVTTNTRDAFTAGNQMAQSVNDATKSLDAFVRYVTAPNTNQTTTVTNRHPYNVLDYGVAASQIGDAARDLNTLLTNLNASAPMFAELSRQTKAQADAVAHRAVWSGIFLITFFLAGSVMATLIYRILCNRWLMRDKKRLDN
jgi:hypothetical protein